MTNFLLYAGCARAGSTWLYGELNARGDCDLSNIKEHFLFVDGFTLNPEFDKSKFFSHYEQLAKNPETLLLGEMSPSNSFATVDQLKWFADEAKKHEFNILPVIILRDPVSKIISETKLNIIANLAQKSNENFSDVFRQFRQKTSNKISVSLDDVLNTSTPFQEKVISWEKTIENYRAVFGNIFIGFYETLFTENCMRELCNYLNIPYSDFDFSRIANKLLDDTEFNSQQKQLIYETVPHCKENYEYAIKTFGKEFIESVWWKPNK